MTNTDIDQLSINTIRTLSIDGVQKANSGHPGLPLGAAPMAYVIWNRFLRYNPRDPRWPNRDRFVLSAGHGSMLLYSLLHLAGYDLSLDELKHFRQWGSKTPGHPESHLTPGVEVSTGPLGQGFGNGVGMAIAQAYLAAHYNRPGHTLFDSYVYAIVSDGDLMEGITHEAASLAGHLKLGKLSYLYDDNHISLDGPTSLAFTEDRLARFAAYGWHTQAIDGHDPAAIEKAIAAAIAETDRPSLIACKTVIGKGAPTKAGKSSSHGAPLGAGEIEGARAALGWPHAPFEIPEEIRAAWRAAGERGAEPSAAWRQRLEAAPEATRRGFDAAIAGALPAELPGAIDAYKRKLSAEKPAWASRKASQMALEVLTATIPTMVGGSADLTHSNLTNTAATKPMVPGDYAGRYVSYGVREHGMMAAMNGMAVHGGIIPYGGTFLVFADYCRPSLRLAALMQQRVIFVATHDSIGLGEDGPTHQPVEHLASLRAIPNMLVFRPADAVETMECWELALRQTDGPSTLALTRQELPTLREVHSEANLCAHGAYLLTDATGKRDVTILGTGSEVHIGLAAAKLLAAEGINAAVVSMPSWELFERQDPAYRASVLGDAPRVAVEAASPFGWTRYVASEADVVGMTSFGASGPIKELYEHFGLTAENVARRARALL